MQSDHRCKSLQLVAKLLGYIMFHRVEVTRP